MDDRKKKIIIVASVVVGVTAVGVGVYLFRDKIRQEVPEFIRMHGLWKSIRYLRGFDVWDEIYNEIGV